MRLDQTATGRTRYGTPPGFVVAMEGLFGAIELDVAADEDLHVCDTWIDDIDAPWPMVRPVGGGALRPPGLAWCNPPYGREIGWFLGRCRRAVRRGEAGSVLCLVPARTDTAWWHCATDTASLAPRVNVMLLRGRITFVGEKHSAPFPSALILYGASPADRWRRQMMSGAKIANLDLLDEL